MSRGLTGFSVGRWSPWLRTLCPRESRQGWETTSLRLWAGGREGAGEAGEGDGSSGRQVPTGLLGGTGSRQDPWALPAPLIQHLRSWFPAMWSLHRGFSRDFTYFPSTLPWLDYMNPHFNTQTRKRRLQEGGGSSHLHPQDLASHRPSSLVPNLPHSSPPLLKVTTRLLQFWGLLFWGCLEQA